MEERRQKYERHHLCLHVDGFKMPKCFFPTVCSFQQLLGCLIQLRRFFLLAASLEALKICQQKLFHCRRDAMRRLRLWFAVCKTHLMKLSSILSHPRSKAPSFVINDFEKTTKKLNEKKRNEQSYEICYFNKQNKLSWCFSLCWCLLFLLLFHYAVICCNEWNATELFANQRQK